MKCSVRLLRAFALLWIAFGAALTTSAQDAVPVEILKRTRFIKCGSEAGTAFAVDYHLKVYLVTARHVAAGLPRTGATIQIWDKEAWSDYKTVRTIFPESDKVDIAVFETAEKLDRP